MLTGQRYRVIIYFAALVLCLSVCFAFAEEPASMHHHSAASTVTSPSVSNVASIHFLYYSAPGRASFLPALSGRLITEPAAPVVQVASADAILMHLGTQADRHHGLHALLPGKHRLKLVKTYSPEQPSADAAQIETSVQE